MKLDPNRPAAAWHDDILHIRASAFGQCPKSLAAVAAGESIDPFPDAVLRAFEQGTRMEDEILEGITDLIDEKVDPPKIEYQKEVRLELLDGFVVLEGSMDMSYPGAVIDAKTTSDLEAKPGDLWPKYQWQLSTYAHAENAEKVALAVAYVDRAANDGAGEMVGDIALEWFQPLSLSFLKARAKIIYNLAVDADTDLATLAATPCDPGPFGCQVQSLHPIIAPATAVDISTLPDDVAIALDTIDRIQQFHENGVSLAEERSAKAVIKKWAQHNAVDKTGVTIDDLTVKLSDPSTYLTVDISPEQLTHLVGGKAAAKFIHEKTRDGRLTVARKN